MSKNIKNEDLGIKKEVEMSVQGLASVSSKIKEDIVKMDPNEIRFIVDAYYQKQDDRKSKYNQLRSIEHGYDKSASERQTTMLEWLAKSSENEEKQIKLLLNKWTDTNNVSKWLKSIIGIGPVFAAALVAYLDVTKASHFNSFTNYAGLNDNNIPWLGKERGTKIAKEIKTNLEPKMEKLSDVFISPVPDNKRQTFRNLISRIMKNVSDDGAAQIFMSIIDFDDIETDNPDERETLESYRDKLMKYPVLSNGHFDEIKEVYEDLFKDLIVSDAELIISIAKYITNPNSIHPITMIEVQKMTNRNPVKSYNSVISLSNTRKKKKSNLYTYTDLASSLALPPYNLKLKTIMYLIGDSFVKRSGNPDSLYGRLYRERKAYEIERNESGGNHDRAVYISKTKNFTNDEVREIYRSGKLPAGHIDNQARRYVEKIFLSHLYEMMYIDKFHSAPPIIYPIAFQGHVDYIQPEVPYSKFTKVPEEYYDNYPWIFRGSPRIDEDPDYYRNNPKFSHIIKIYEEKLAINSANN